MLRRIARSSSSPSERIRAQRSCQLPYSSSATLGSAMEGLPPCTPPEPFRPPATERASRVGVSSAGFAAPGVVALDRRDLSGGEGNQRSAEQTVEALVGEDEGLGRGLGRAERPAS